jgi:hypothetical protein
MPGRKSDAKDAQWIAGLLFKNMLRGSLVPSPLKRELRTYTREYRNLVNQRTGVLTQMERILVMCGIPIRILYIFTALSKWNIKSNITKEKLSGQKNGLPVNNNFSVKVGYLCGGNLFENSNKNPVCKATGVTCPNGHKHTNMS